MGTSSRKMHAGTKNYLKDQARSFRRYYEGTEGKSFPRAWGKLAEHFGITNGITDAQWDDLFAGRWDGQELRRNTGYRTVVDPKTGEQTREPYSTPGFDILFDCPKWVSLLYVTARTEDQARAIENAVLDAAQIAWTEAVENYARGARVTLTDAEGNRVVSAITADLVGVPVLQFATRPNTETLARGNDYGDPHLHVHTATFATCRALVDGVEKFFTFDEAAIKRTAAYRRDVFDGTLIQNMQALGYQVELTDVEDSKKGLVHSSAREIGQDLVDFFSSNHRRLKVARAEFEATHGRPPTREELETIRANTKGPKGNKAMDTEPVRDLWIQDARRAGLTVNLTEPTTDKQLRRDFKRLHELVMGRYGLTMNNAVFNDDAIKPTIARCAIGLGLSREDLLSYEFELRNALVTVRQSNDPRHRLYTTPAILSMERFIAERAQDKSNAVPVSRMALRYSTKLKLDAEQRAALEAMCSYASWVNITGVAGSGKSAVAAAAAEAHRLAKTADCIVAVAVSAKTANDFGRKIKADRWGSFESILTQIEKGAIKPSRETVWMIDEAAIVDTHRMHDFLRVAGKGRVILIGDAKQATPIGPGGWYQDQLDKNHSVHLTKAHRHTDALDSYDYDLVRSGQGTRALQRLEARGRVHLSTNEATRVKDVTDHITRLRLLGVEASDIRVIVEGSNESLDTINRFCQNQRGGELGANGFTVTELESGREWTLRRGDQVIFLRPVYERGTAPIRNGTAGTLQHIDDRGRARVQLEDGRTTTVRLSAQEWTQPIGLGYAVHVSKFQGSEVKQNIVLPTRGLANGNNGYSQLTRGVDATHVFIAENEWDTDPVAELGAAWSTHDLPRTASSYLDDVVAAQPERESPLQAWMDHYAREDAYSMGLER